ncbi:MAG: hypothetical protein P8Q14_00070 [Vicingaceae bacterium]|nr:hypothetical protein [Vicingaceae bacterium]
MAAVKQILLKGSLLLLLLTALNLIYKATLWQDDVIEYSNIEKVIKTAKNAEILYLGDCSDSYFGYEVENEKGISQILDSLLPNTTVATISETGFHAGMYARTLDQLPEHTNIKTIIVTMNLRSFSSYVFYAYEANSIDQRMVMLKNRPPLLNRFLLTFKENKVYKGPAIKEQLKTQQKNDKTPLTKYNSTYQWKSAIENEKWSKGKKELAIGHLNNYGVQITASATPRINDFDEIVAITKKKKLKLIFHLLPENTHETKQLIGEDLTNLIAHNRNFLHERYNTENIIIIDNMELLPATDFIEKLPNSHFYYSGRRKMAEEIAKFLK